jgi:hypothetical protein
MTSGPAARRCGSRAAGELRWQQHARQGPLSGPLATPSEPLHADPAADAAAPERFGTRGRTLGLSAE